MAKPRFCLDTRAIRPETLVQIRARLAGLIADLERRHGVSFDIGPDSGPPIALMDAGLTRRLVEIAGGHRLRHRRMPSGAGHDAAAFAAAGVPTVMLFIRNEHGSHNPNEAMDISDFEAAGTVLVQFLAEFGAAAQNPR